MYALLIEGASPDEVEDVDEQLAAPLTAEARTAEQQLAAAVREVFHGNPVG